MPAEYLAAATNVLSEILAHQELDADDLRQATDVACKALNRLYNDPDLERAFNALNGVEHGQRTAVHSIVDDTSHFTVHFMRRELNLLEKECKLDCRVIEALRKAARDVHEAVRAEQPSFAVLKRRILIFRDEACGVSAEVKRVLDQPRERDRIVKYTLMIIGVLVILGERELRWAELLLASRDRRLLEARM
jgi:hypothetical protein